MEASLITLGCNKNEIDSEMIVGYLKEKGFKITNNLIKSECIVINTCGFIQSAKEEAIDTILQMSEYKEQGICKYIIVTGCLAKRYKKEIYENLPEVDLVIGVDEYEDIDNIISNFFNLTIDKSTLDMNKREVSSLYPMAYIRISDGCNNRCHYCAIPAIRGKLKSRKIEEILLEANNMVMRGIREIVVIAQDTTAYGEDIYGKCRLVDLLEKMSKIAGLKYIRVLYMYPGKVTDELVNLIKSNDKICKYFDIPVQHISDKMLKSMNRHTTKKQIYDLVDKIRKDIPEAIIRTTVMVGYQGEDENDFNELLNGIMELKFDRLGAFEFSKEQDTYAEKLGKDVDRKIKKKRYNLVMQAQQQVVLESMKNKLNKVIEIVVESVSEDEKYFVCRSYMDAPDIDPKIYLSLEQNINHVIIGEYYNVKLVDIVGYDYIAVREEI